MISLSDRVNQPTTLKLEIGTKSLEIISINSWINSEAEVAWMAYEVSEWLDQPLTIIESPVIG
jgi:hypothetical protein